MHSTKNPNELSCTVKITRELLDMVNKFQYQKSVQSKKGITEGDISAGMEENWKTGKCNL